jgi:hypothetical protein
LNLRTARRQPCLNQRTQPGPHPEDHHLPLQRPKGARAERAKATGQGSQRIRRHRHYLPRCDVVMGATIQTVRHALLYCEQSSHGPEGSQNGTRCTVLWLSESCKTMWGPSRPRGSSASGCACAGSRRSPQRILRTDCGHSMREEPCRIIC